MCLALQDTVAYESSGRVEQRWSITYSLAEMLGEHNGFHGYSTTLPDPLKSPVAAKRARERTLLRYAKMCERRASRRYA